VRFLAASSGDLSECNKSARACVRVLDLIHYRHHGDFQRKGEIIITQIGKVQIFYN